LEDFLKLEEGNLDMAGYLWRFYVIQNRFTDAAYVLSELADAPGLTLEKRIEYLTMAVSNARSVSASDNPVSTTILSQLDDSLAVI
jgi:nuclear pore complex protein Nup155